MLDNSLNIDSDGLQEITKNKFLINLPVSKIKIRMQRLYYYMYII